MVMSRGSSVCSRLSVWHPYLAFSLTLFIGIQSLYRHSVWHPLLAFSLTPLIVIQSLYWHSVRQPLLAYSPLMAFSLTPFIGIQSDTLYWHSVRHPLLAYNPFIGIQSDTLYWHVIGFWCMEARACTSSVACIQAFHCMTDAVLSCPLSWNEIHFGLWVQGQSAYHDEQLSCAGHFDKMRCMCWYPWTIPCIPTHTMNHIWVCTVRAMIRPVCTVSLQEQWTGVSRQTLLRVPTTKCTGRQGINLYP